MRETKNRYKKQSNSHDIYDGPVFKIARFVFHILCRWTPQTAAFLAIKIFSRPRRFRRPLRESHILDTAQRLNVQTRSGNIAAWLWGTGPTILCIHGWEGRGTQFYEYVNPLVQAGYRVVLFDGPAHGDSAGTYTNLIHFTDEVKELLKTVGPLHGIIAHSFGGAVATLLLKTNVSVGKVVFFAVPNNIIEITENFGTILGLTAEVVHQMREEFLERHRKAWNAYVDSWEDLIMAQMAKTFSVPLLIIHDQHDRDVKISNSEALCQAWPEAKLIQTTGLGHQRILRDPEVMAEVLNFITPAQVPEAHLEK